MEHTYRDAQKRLSALSLYCAPGTMRRCKHHGLFDIATSDQPCLIDTFRLRRLIDGLPLPSEQYPQLVTCLGSNEKDLALAQLFPASRLKTAGVGVCKAYLDVTTTSDRHPVIFIDADKALRATDDVPESHCHQSKPFRISPHLALDDFGATLVRHLLIPFSSVLCVFAEDLGGLSGVADRLQVWVEAAKVTAPSYTRMIVATTDDEHTLGSKTYEALIERIERLAQACSLASIRIENISLLPLRVARYTTMGKGALVEELKAAKEAREAHMTLYSATHVAALFSGCIAHAARSSPRPFDFFQATRQGIPCPPYLEDCLHAFLKAAHRHEMPHQTLASVLATSLLMHAYPQSSHRKSHATLLRFLV
jgi:hypothetical protein